MGVLIMKNNNTKIIKRNEVSNMKTKNYPSHYFLQETIKGFFAPQGFECTPTALKLLENKNYMQSVDLSELTMIQPQYGDTLSVEQFFDQAFELERDDTLEQERIKEAGLRESFDRDFLFDNVTGRYHLKAEYFGY